MSIFYNPSTAHSGTVQFMKRTKTLKMVALIGAGGFAIVYAHAQTPAPSAAALEQIAFFTAHEWDAKLPDSPGGKEEKDPRAIHLDAKPSSHSHQQRTCHGREGEPLH